MMPYTWVDIGSGNVLLPDGTKPLPEPMLIYYQNFSIRLRAILQVLTSLIHNNCWELLSHLPGVNELNLMSPR